MKLVNVQEMRRIEQAADAGGHSYATMMERAGEAVASTAVALQLIEAGERVLVLVGPGNNGGDGLVAARYFREMDIEITLYIWKRDIKGDGNFRKLKQRRRGTDILWADNDPDYAKLREEIRRSELIIDALLGTGAARPIDGQLAEILTVVKRRDHRPADCRARNRFRRSRHAPLSPHGSVQSGRAHAAPARAS